MSAGEVGLDCTSYRYFGCDGICTKEAAASAPIKPVHFDGIPPTSLTRGKRIMSLQQPSSLFHATDNEDPSERGRALVSSREGWRTQLVKWIGAITAAVRAEDDSDLQDDNDDETMYPPMTLAILFGGAEKPRACTPSARAMAEEEVLMEELANAMEDDVPDDGAIEIDSDDEDRS
ncbi:hypothetical protein B0H14DRAFT_2619672 [Mycena olivaceomarginata]|nr:hypothetical protein B0H14DRAFT_2619672 [Mycena olivaceomarginata]